MKIFAKNLKKNAVAVDLICFGDVSAVQRTKVETFLTTLNHKDNIQSMFIEPGEVYLSEKLLGSKIFMWGVAGGNIGRDAKDIKLKNSDKH